MCNAWNHSLSCTCGWGGEGARGGGGGSGFSDESGLTRFSDLIRTRYKLEARAYVNPNAKCPVCSVPVYFYQAPEGGRVFFDQLGKPWPKHPCMANVSSKDVKVDFLSLGRIEIKSSDWLPFICNSIHPAPLMGDGVYVLEGLYDHSAIKLFCKVSGLHVRAPYLLRKSELSDSSFAVTTVIFSGEEAEPIEFVASRSAISLIPEFLRRPPLPIPTKKYSKSTRAMKFVEDAKRVALVEKKSKEHKPEKQPLPRRNSSLGPTAMEMAFGRADQEKEDKSK